MSSLNKINRCEVCGASDLQVVLDLGKHPMCDDLIAVGSDSLAEEYPIEIMFCPDCITAHQRYQVPKRTLFPDNYHYRARFTADVLNGMEKLVLGCKERFGSLEGKKVVDIGCNDGSLLQHFRKNGAFTVGIEPTDAVLDARKVVDAAYKEYLSVDICQKVVREHGHPDFITMTNVFAHVENLDDVLKSLQALMSKTTVLVIENHYLGSVLKGNQFDTFYHEHPRTYSFCSFMRIAQTLGVNIMDVVFPSRYGGNIQIFMGNLDFAGNIDIAALKQKESDFGTQLTEMQTKIESWKNQKKQEINGLVKKFGPLSAKAFPGRAAILVKLLGLTENEVECVYEKPNSLKVGHYLPGTKIPIRSDDELFSKVMDDESPILNFAWHIPQEIKRYLKENGVTSEVIDILSADNF
jgi:hypothetical protein